MSVNIQDVPNGTGNFKRWNALKENLNVDDSTLVDILLSNYDQGKFECKWFNKRVEHLHVGNLLEKLNTQRSFGALFCDLVIKLETPVMIPDPTHDANNQTVMYAHKGLLCALLGEPFIAQLNKIQEIKNDITSNTSIAKGIGSGTENVLTLPMGFKYVVEYCYTGAFSSLDGVDEQQVKIVIDSMVENGNFKQKMLAQLAASTPTNVLPSPTSVTIDESNTSNSSSKPKVTVACDLDDIQSATGQSPEEILEVRRKRKSRCPNQDFLWSDGSNSDKEGDYDESFIPDEISTTSSHPEDTSDHLDSETELSEAADPMTKGCMCIECDRFFINKAKLEEHFKDHEAIKQKAALLPPKRRRGRPKGSKNKPVPLPATDLPKRKRKSRIDVSDEIGTNSRSFSGGKPFKKTMGECCGEIFFRKHSFGVHIFESHSDIMVQCAICAAFINLQSQLAHYQTVHNYGPFPENNQQVLQKYINNFTGQENVTDHNGNETNSLLSTDRISNKAIDVGGGFHNEHMLNVTNQSRVPLNINQCDGIPADLSLSGGLNSRWNSETVCVDCRQKMSILKYVEHLQVQYDLAKASICGSSKSNNYKCLYMNCKLCPTFEKSIHLYTFFRTHMDRYHIKNALGDMRVTCTECGRTVLKYYMKKHLEKHAKGPEKLSLENRAVACDVCGKTVKRRRLKIHRRTHFEQYPCQYCSKVFNRRENLHVHIRIHTGEKPFVCDICGKGFRQYVELRLHNRRHRKEEGANETAENALVLVAPNTTAMDNEEHDHQFHSLMGATTNQTFQYKLH